MNKYIEKLAELKAIKTKVSISDLKGDGRDTLSQRSKIESSLEAIPHAKSLREVLDSSAKKSYKSSQSRGGGGQSTATAIRNMQSKASTPRSSELVTNKRL